MKIYTIKWVGACLVPNKTRLSLACKKENLGFFKVYVYIMYIQVLGIESLRANTVMYTLFIRSLLG